MLLKKLPCFGTCCSVCSGGDFLHLVCEVRPAAKSLQSCPTRCDPIDGSPPGSAVPGILQARTRVGCNFLLQCMKMKSESKSLSHVQLFATPWTAAYQAPLSMGFSRQEYWSGVPLPSLEVCPSPTQIHILKSFKALSLPLGRFPFLSRGGIHSHALWASTMLY